MCPAIGREDKHLYEFGAFRLDPAERVLARNGDRISLPPKAFDTLLILVRHSGHVLSKEQLLQTLWPDSFVEENNLTQQISVLRKALGTHPSKSMKGGPTTNNEEQEYIETVPKLGYRFVADVRDASQPDVVITKRTRTHIVVREEIEEEEADVAVETAAVPGAVVARRKVAFAIAAISLALVALAAYRFRVVTPAQPAILTGSPRSVAILPLRNLKPDPETDFLSMALADAITNRLGYASELTVAPLSSVAKYRNTDADARQIARELNVQNVLAGTYVKEGDDLRISLEFISAEKGGSPWRENLELKYEKLFTVQDRVAIDVIHAMGLQLQPEQADSFRRGAPANPVAYEYYLRGLDHGFHSDFAGAKEQLEKSVALEPQNAMAWTMLATVYLGTAAVQNGDAENTAKGWQAFQRAIKLDPDNRFIVDLMAFHLLEHNKAEQAVPLLRESLQHNPMDSFAHWYLSEAYRYGGALEQSVAEGELALKLNPNVAENLTFNTYLYIGQYEKFLASLPRDENNARTIFYRGLAHYSMRDTRVASEEFDRAFALNPTLLHAQIGQALGCALRQENAKGLDIMRSVERSGGNDGEMLYKMAQAYAQLGDRLAALRLLRRSIELNFYPYPYFARDPLLEPVRAEPDYSAVLDLARQRQETFFLKQLRGKV